VLLFGPHVKLEKRFRLTPQQATPSYNIAVRYTLLHAYLLVEFLAQIGRQQLTSYYTNGFIEELFKLERMVE
jgi:hypothetical protein